MIKLLIASPLILILVIGITVYVKTIISIATNIATNESFNKYLESFVRYVTDEAIEVNTLISEFKQAIQEVGRNPVQRGTRAAAKMLTKFHPEYKDACISTMHELLDSLNYGR
jgi:hypothetical protein